MDRRLQGERSPEKSLEGVPNPRSGLSNQRALMLRRESAMFNALGSLMRLYEYPSARGQCDQILQRLRDIRMIGLDDDGSDLAGLGAQFENAPDSASADEARLHHLKQFATFQQGMKDRMAKRQARHDEQIAKSDRLLLEALEQAKRLLSNAS